MLYHTFSKKTVSYSYRKSIIPPVLLSSLNQFGSESSHRAEFLNEYCHNIKQIFIEIFILFF